MTGREMGFLLLGSSLGNPDRKKLTAPQLRVLAARVSNMAIPDPDRALAMEDLTALGYGSDMARRILMLLEEEDLLQHYLCRGRQCGCVPLTRVSGSYPLILRKRLGLDSPACLWAKGDLAILDTPAVALVGSRELRPENLAFAQAAGHQAAEQGYTLISGNARGADQAAQKAALEAGGRVICVVADKLQNKDDDPRILYLSEEDFDQPFSPQRALSRNRVIHALGQKTLVAQSSLRTGGTWDGTVKNLRFHWSPVFCFQDGSESINLLSQMGAGLISADALKDLSALTPQQNSFLDP